MGIFIAGVITRCDITVTSDEDYELSMVGNETRAGGQVALLRVIGYQCTGRFNVSGRFRFGEIDALIGTVR